MPVPLFDTQSALRPLRAEVLAAIERVVDGGRFVLGPEVEAFERDLAAWLGAPHVVGVANGTEAITIALRALGVGPGDEVVVPSFTFYASAEAIPPTGAAPVFCDVDPETMCATPETVRAALTPRTKAVVAVHLFGNLAPVAEIEALGVPVVEDAAQAAGARAAGQPGDERPHRGPVAGAPDDRDAVGDARLQPRRQLDRLEAAVRRPHVGEVEQAGVGGALRELGGDPADVGLVRAHVGEDRVAARAVEAAEHPARVRADRHARSADRDRDAVALEVVERAHLRRARRDGEDEPVGGERPRALDEAGVEELAGQLRVRGGEHVGLGPRPDLRRELVGARERELDVGLVEPLGVALEGALQRRGGGDEQLAAVAGAGARVIVGAAAGGGECGGGEQRRDGDEGDERPRLT